MRNGKIVAVETKKFKEGTQEPETFEIKKEEVVEDGKIRRQFDDRNKA